MILCIIEVSQYKCIINIIGIYVHYTSVCADRHIIRSHRGYDLDELGLERRARKYNNSNFIDVTATDPCSTVYERN